MQYPPFVYISKPVYQQNLFLGSHNQHRLQYISLRFQSCIGDRQAQAILHLLNAMGWYLFLSQTLRSLSNFLPCYL